MESKTAAVIVFLFISVRCNDVERCASSTFTHFLDALQSHYRECRSTNVSVSCLPDRVSHHLVGLAGDIVEEEIESANTKGSFLGEYSCPDGLVAALAVYAHPLGHTERGQWAARNAFRLASRECWPTLGFRQDDWPVTYAEILEVVLHAEAWEEYGDAAEFERPPRHAMPQPFIHDLTPTHRPSPQVNRDRTCDASSCIEQRRKVRILSTGHHASYPAAVFSMWHALLKEFEFVLEDYSFDTRYCDLTNTCSIDERFAWIGEHLRATIVETCGGLYLKGFDDISALAEKLFALLSDSGLIESMDVLLCTHPPYSCRLFWPFVLRLEKPLLGFFGGTLEAHVPRVGTREWLQDFREMSQHPLVQFAAISPFLAEKMRYQSGVDIPAARGFGFHLIAQGATYLPTRANEVLIWKNSMECVENQMDFDNLLEDIVKNILPGKEVPLQFHHLRELRARGESSYSSLLSFRAVVFVPYEILLMTFYELYHAAIPLFVPTLQLGAFFAYRGPVTYPHCDMTLTVDGRERPQPPYSPFSRDNATDRLAWLEAYTDWYRFPHLQRFSSLVELVNGLYSLNMQSVSAAMRQESEGALVEAASFWRRAFSKVFGTEDVVQ